MRRGRFTREDVALAGVGVVVTGMLWQRPLLQAGTETSFFYIRPWDIAWLVFVVCCGTWLWGRRADALLAARSPVLLAYCAFVAAAALSLVWGYITFGDSGFVSSAVRLLRLMAVALLAAAVALLATDPRRRTVLGATVVAVATVGALMAIYGWAFAGTDEVGGAVTRAGGPFGNFLANGTGEPWWTQAAGANYLGFWLAVSLTVTVAWTLRPRADRPRAGLEFGLGSAVAGVLTVGLLATHSRESWVAAAFTLAAVLWIQRRPPLRSWWTAASLAGCAAIVPIVLAVPSLRARVLDSFTPGTFSYESGPQARFEAWEAGLEWALDRFPIGWGLGAIEEHPQLFGGATAENTFLQVFAQLGVPGLLALLALLGLGMVRTLPRVTQQPADAGHLFAAAFFTATCVHGIFGNTLGDPTVQVLLGCAVGIAAADIAGEGTSVLWRGWLRRSAGAARSRQGHRTSRSHVPAAERGSRRQR